MEQARWCLTTGQPAQSYKTLTRLEREAFYEELERRTT